MIHQRIPVRNGTVHISPQRSVRRSTWPYYALTYAALGCIAASVLWHLDQTAFVSLPAIALLLAALSVSVAFACGGQAYVHGRFCDRDFVKHNEVGGFIIAVAGTLYAVLLGFLTAVAWQEFADARQVVGLESAAATDIWHAAIGLPEAERSRVRADALAYSNAMIDSEWPQMQAGRFDTKPDYIIMDAMTAAGTFKPANLMESNSQAATLQQLSTLHDTRQRRLTENDSAISGFEWLVLILGAGAIIAFCWIFGLANRRIHLLMTATVAVLTTSVLVLLFELQFPFRSALHITPDSWVASVKHIHLMQNGPQMGMRM